MKPKPAPTKPQKKQPAPDLTYVPEGELPQLFLVFTDGGEWRTKDGGSTPSLLSAGTFTQFAADQLVSADGGSVLSLERAVREATRAGNPVVMAAIAALGGR